MATEFYFICVLILLSATVNACEPPDCDRPDHGTCVMACCKLAFTVEGLQPKETIEKIAKVET